MSDITAATEVADITFEDVIDSRDLIELGETVQAWLDAIEDPYDEDVDRDEYDLSDARAIVAAVAEFESAGVADWLYGETFVRDSYFVEYAQELADDIGAIDSDAGWPMSCIDWGRAAHELQMDYTAVEVNGITYWAR